MPGARREAGQAEPNQTRAPRTLKSGSRSTCYSLYSGLIRGVGSNGEGGRERGLGSSSSHRRGEFQGGMAGEGEGC